MAFRCRVSVLDQVWVMEGRSLQLGEEDFLLHRTQFSHLEETDTLNTPPRSHPVLEEERVRGGHVRMAKPLMLPADGLQPATGTQHATWNYFFKRKSTNSYMRCIAISVLSLRSMETRKISMVHGS